MMKNKRAPDFVNQEGYERLGNEIVILAAKDYKRALKVLQKDSNNYTALAEVNSIERFFHGRLYSAITTIDPDVMIRKLREDVGYDEP